MALWHIALGGNVGDVRGTFSRALQLLMGDDLSVVQISRIYRTSAIGERAGESFLNAAAAIETDLEPLSLLDRLQGVESALGRTRDIRWGPRPIDLDLIVCGKRVIDEPRLSVPHPAAWYRRFVLDPLVEIAGGVLHPVKGVTIHELRARLLPRPLQVALAGGKPEERSELQSRLREEFSGVSFPAGEQGKHEAPALILWLGETDAERSSDGGFEDLPRLPRLDASAFSKSLVGATEFARGVLQAALDEPVVCD